MEEITFEHIIRYLENGLSEEEKNHLEGLAQEDSALTSRIEEAKQLLRGIRRGGEKEVEENVKSFHVDFRKSNEFSRLSGEKISLKIVSLRTKWLAIAASILVLFFVGYSFFKTNAEQRLFAENKTEESKFVQDQIEFLGRAGMASNNIESLKKLMDGLIAYQSSNYSQSANTLKDYLKTNPEDSVALLYLALSNLSGGNYGEAESSLRKLIDSPNTEVRDISRWYLSLLHIRSNRYQEARLLLQSIVLNPASYYKDRAESLLFEIKGK